MENKDYKELYEEQLQKYFLKSIESVVCCVLAFSLLLFDCLDILSVGVTGLGIASLICLVLCFSILKDDFVEVYECWEENESILSKLTKRRKK